MIRRMSDDNDARRLEKALQKLEGVLEAQASFASERARLRYIPTVISQAEIRSAIEAAGFKRWRREARQRTPSEKPARRRSHSNGIT
jgi:Cu+-exporting ATPase